jgi:hypothetical protein
MNTTISNAIRNRNVLEFSYNGLYREVEPHAYGLSHTNKEVIRCYQTSGCSSSEVVPCWRLMEVYQIMGLTVTPRHFVGTRPGYRKGDKSMSIIFCEL